MKTTRLRSGEMIKIGDYIKNSDSKGKVLGKGVFDIIYNIKRTQDVFEKYVNYPDGFVYFLEDGFHYGRGEVVKFKSGNFGIISDVDLAGQRDYCFNGEFYRYDKGDDLRTAAGDGYIYTMKTGYCYTSNQFSIANMDKKSTREAYVLWMLEN